MVASAESRENFIHSSNTLSRNDDSLHFSQLDSSFGPFAHWALELSELLDGASEIHAQSHVSMRERASISLTQSFA